MSEWIPRTKPVQVETLVIRGKTIPPPLVQLLSSRGWDTPRKIEQYFAPSLEELHDPFAMAGMDGAVKRLLKAIHDQETILVYGDYDTDGITGTALVVRNIKKLGLAVESYIPHRLHEGYGMSRAGVVYAQEKGCSLIVAVDCGITAVDEVAYAHDLGIDVIICDHHKPARILPKACALLDPKLPEDAYPFKELAGVGVAFKMLVALHEQLGKSTTALYQDLDLVALGTVVDVVPLVDENRTLVKYGSRSMKRSRKAGFQALLKELGLRREPTSYDLGFIIGPRINACGRLRDAQDALRLFLTEDIEVAQQLVQALSTDNKKRQEIQDTMYREAVTLVEEARLCDKRVIIVGKETWHEGIVGNVASRLSDKYHRPAILLSIKEESAKGSARSIHGFDITAALSQIDDMIIRYGGHSQAAGVEIRANEIERFERRLNEVAQHCDQDIFVQKIYYDIELGFEDITGNFLNFLKFFEPTGLANPLPVFLGRNLEVVGVPHVVKNEHLKFALRSRDIVYPAMAFEQAEAILDIEVGQTRIDCLYSIAQESYHGKKKNLLKVKAMRKSQE